MKRLNPKTNKPFVRGDVREDGRIFDTYKTNSIKKDGFFVENWITQESFKKRNKHHKEKVKNHYKNNKEKYKQNAAEWSKQNPEKRKEIRSKDKKAHRDRENYHNAKRRAALLQRTPKWLTEEDFWMIEEAYSLAALRTKLFGFQWHVDHRTPLCGKTVSGLHVPTNLQVIPGPENVRKNNKYDDWGQNAPSLA